MEFDLLVFTYFPYSYCQFLGLESPCHLYSFVLVAVQFKLLVGSLLHPMVVEMEAATFLPAD